MSHSGDQDRNTQCRRSKRRAWGSNPPWPPGPGQKGTGYPAFGQPGRATDADGDGLFEASPCYAWDNTLNGAKPNMVLRPWANHEHEAKQAEHVKEGRDFFNEKPRPECYRPYIYPHPQQEGWGTSSRAS